MAILERRLSLGEAPEIDEHLDRCDVCRALVAGLACDLSTPDVEAAPCRAVSERASSC